MNMIRPRISLWLKIEPIGETKFLCLLIGNSNLIFFQTNRKKNSDVWLEIRLQLFHDLRSMDRIPSHGREERRYKKFTMRSSLMMIFFYEKRDSGRCISTRMGSHTRPQVYMNAESMEGWTRNIFNIAKPKNQIHR